jgi:geranylgeranyl diphosphate synthase, type I
MSSRLPRRIHIHVGWLKTIVEARLVRLPRRWPGHAHLVRDAIRHGHRSRPIACMLACEAVGGSWRDALPMAIALELGHKSSVIRDDLTDGDDYRAGRPAFYRRHGLPLAITVSDLLWSASLAELADAQRDSRIHTLCLPLFAQTYHAMCLGQLNDVLPNRPTHATPADRLQVDALKTGSLAALALRTGAIAGGGTPEQVEDLGKFGDRVGTAFQVMNDVNNLLGRETTAKRRPATDLHLGRYTLLVAYSRREASGPVRRRIDELAARTSPLEDTAVAELRDILLSLGAHRYGEELARSLLAESRQYLDALPPTLAREAFQFVSTTDHFRRVLF